MIRKRVRGMLYRMLKFTVTIVCLLTMPNVLEGSIHRSAIRENNPRSQ